MKKLFILVFSLHCLGIKAQEIEDAPSPEFVQQLESLSNPNATDTAAAYAVVTTGGKQYRISTFELSKKLGKPVSGINESAKKLNELIKSKATAAYKKFALINSLRDTAIYLCRNDFDFIADTPYQHKIAYSWGSKYHTVRQTPPGEADNCNYKIHGLDCSGFIYQLFALNGIKLPVAQCNAATERNPVFLKQYLKPYFENLSFEVEDMGGLTIKEIQSGDIIYFKNSKGNVYHIGILFVNEAGEVTFYQSIGQPNKSDNDDKICQTNIDDHHGVTVKKISDEFLKGYKDKYGCVRIITKKIK